MKHKYVVILPCAGVGSRFGNDIPKQYIKINNRYLIEYTLDAILDVLCIDEVYIIVNNHDKYIDDIVNQYLHKAKSKIKILYLGGDTRAKTVFNGLNAIKHLDYYDWVLVHDIVRCYINPQLVENLILRVQDDMVGGILAIPVSDTVKMVQNNYIIKTIDRHSIYLAQTPQIFRYGVLIDAYNSIDNYSQMTDESSIIEAFGKKVLLVQGHESNIKITYSSDIQ